MFKHLLGFPGGSIVKNLSAKQETQILSLGQEYQKWQPTLGSLPGKSQGQLSLMSYSPWESQRVGRDWATNTFTFKEDWVEMKIVKIKKNRMI